MTVKAYHKLRIMERHFSPELSKTHNMVHIHYCLICWFLPCSCFSIQVSRTTQSYFCDELCCSIRTPYLSTFLRASCANKHSWKEFCYCLLLCKNKSGWEDLTQNGLKRENSQEGVWAPYSKGGLPNLASYPTATSTNLEYSSWGLLTCQATACQ